MSKDADILQMRMQIIGMSEDIHNYQAALTEKEAELAAARGKIDKAKSILSMGHTQRERNAWEALKEAE